MVADVRLLPLPTSFIAARSAVAEAISGAAPRRLKPLLAIAAVAGLLTDPFISGRAAAAAAPHDLELAGLSLAASRPIPSAFAFSSLVRALSAASRPSDALRLFAQMLSAGRRPDRFVLPFTFRAAVRSSPEPEPARALHGLAVKVGLDGESHVGTSLLHAYASFGLMVDAIQVFDEMPLRTVVTYNAVISRCGKSGWGVKGVAFMAEMMRNGVEPNEDSFVAVVSCCSNEGLIVNGKAVHSLALRRIQCIGVELDTCFVHMYCKCGSLENGRKVFDGMLKRDGLAWTAMIGGLALYGYGEDAVYLFQRMVAEGVPPDSKAFTAVLHACSHSGLVETGIGIFNDMRRVYMVEPRYQHYGVMVDMLSRAGRIGEAEQIIKLMPFEPNQIILGALLHGCMNNGESESGEQLRQKLAASWFSGGKEQSEFFVGMSNVCAKSGKWDDVGRLRDKMVEKGVKKEKGFSLIEVKGKVY